MPRKALFVAGFATIYTFGVAAVSVLAMSAALSGFEPGDPVASRATIQFLGFLTRALLLPLVPLFAPDGAPGLWGYALVWGNGAIWGGVVVALWSVVARRRRGAPFITSPSA